MNFVTKNIKKISVILFIAVVLCCIVFSQNSTNYTFYGFDTFVTLTLYGRNTDNAAEKAEGLLISLENELSLYRSGSITNKINNAETGSQVKVPEKYANLLLAALDISEKSGGAFDITIQPLSQLWDVKNRTTPPTEDEILKAKNLVGYKKLIVTDNTVTKTDDVTIDLGGIAKGYAADEIKKLLVSEGIKKGIINMGGNVCTIGKKTGNSGWNIGICNPFDPSQIITDVKVSDSCVVTSGGYQRYFKHGGETYHHIISPYTGYPANSGLSSVSIVCENGMLADALSTAAFILGETEGEKLVKSFRAKGIFVRNDGSVYSFASE